MKILIHDSKLIFPSARRHHMVIAIIYCSVKLFSSKQDPGRSSRIFWGPICIGSQKEQTEYNFSYSIGFTVFTTFCMFSNFSSFLLSAVFSLQNPSFKVVSGI